MINEGVSSLIAQPRGEGWLQTLIATILGAVEGHPLARRVLAGLEPDVTERVAEIPALTELRKVCAERIRSEQLEGTVRADVDPAAIGSGIVSITLSLLMSVIQIGPNVAVTYGVRRGGGARSRTRARPRHTELRSRRRKATPPASTIAAATAVSAMQRHGVEFRRRQQRHVLERREVCAPSRVARTASPKKPISEADGEHTPRGPRRARRNADQQRRDAGNHPDRRHEGQRGTDEARDLAGVADRDAVGEADTEPGSTNGDDRAGERHRQMAAEPTPAARRSGEQRLSRDRRSPRCAPATPNWIGEARADQRQHQQSSWRGTSRRGCRRPGR